MPNKPAVFAIMATCGRMTCARRSLRCFLEQDYEGIHKLLIFNNAEHSLTLNLPYIVPSNKQISLINHPYTTKENRRYENLGEIYNDAFALVPTDTFPITIFWDDDDIFLPNHISSGVSELVNSGRKAYKPKYSYYRSAEGIKKVENTLEPSIFVSSSHIQKYGFSPTTVDQHLQWVNPLRAENELFINPDGEPTLIYNWGDAWPTFKTSGDPCNPENFNNYRKHSKEFGDGVLFPQSRDEYYNLINQLYTNAH
jgi:hypothetical protein